MRARNQLYKTIGMPGALTYALLIFPIGVGVPQQTIVSALAFFLVGAVVGLFNPLNLDGSVETAVEDYGLAAVRLLHTPLVSGLAALLGSVTLPLLSVRINPTGDVNAAGQQTIVTPTLQAIFDVTARPFSLVLAAVFGLTPSALLSRLQNEAEKYKSDVKASEAPAARGAQP